MERRPKVQVLGKDRALDGAGSMLHSEDDVSSAGWRENPTKTSNEEGLCDESVGLRLLAWRLIYYLLIAGIEMMTGGVKRWNDTERRTKVTKGRGTERNGNTE